MPSQTGRRSTVALAVLMVLAALVLVPRALADPEVDASPSTDPSPAEVSVASINPSDGSTVGVAKPIVINFAAPVADRPMAEQAIHISSDPPVPGKFYWMSDCQLRWRPFDFWPARTTVTVDAAGRNSTFAI